MDVAAEPKYRRSWTRIRNARSEYTYRQLIRRHDLSGVPEILVRQFAQVAVRAHQLDKQIADIERPVQRSVIKMDAATFQRWSFLMSEFRRYADSVDRLAKAVFGGDRRPPSLDLVAQMARATEAETVEPEPAAASESD
jgi:hypothetical protein